MSARPQPVCHVRRMVAADLGAVSAIEQQAYQFPWSAGIFRDCMRMGYACLAATGISGQLMGYCFMSAAAGEAHILNICVDAAWQRRGVATVLMDNALAVARAGHAGRVFLEVRPSNTAAITLYQQLGFDRVGLRKRYYRTATGREDALLLALSLEA